jgi:hypothetical protein
MQPDQIKQAAGSTQTLIHYANCQAKIPAIFHRIFGIFRGISNVLYFQAHKTHRDFYVRNYYKKILMNVF